MRPNLPPTPSATSSRSQGLTREHRTRIPRETDSASGGPRYVTATTWRRLNRRRDHRWAAPRFSDYLDGELGGDEERRLAQHEELCHECARLMRTLRVLLAILPSLRVPPPATLDVAERRGERVRALIEEWS